MSDNQQTWDRWTSSARCLAPWQSRRAVRGTALSKEELTYEKMSSSSPIQTWPSSSLSFYHRYHHNSWQSRRGRSFDLKKNLPIISTVLPIGINGYGLQYHLGSAHFQLHTFLPFWMTLYAWLWDLGWLWRLAPISHNAVWKPNDLCPLTPLRSKYAKWGQPICSFKPTGRLGRGGEGIATTQLFLSLATLTFTCRQVFNVFAFLISSLRLSLHMKDF